VSAAVGYGLFAARDFKKDEFIFHEAPILSALFHEADSENLTLMRGQLTAYRNAVAENSDELITAYPVLAASHGVTPVSFDTADGVLKGSTLGKFLVHGRYAGSAITKGEYEAFTAKIQVADDPSENDCRLASRNFFRHYAFDAGKDSQGVLPGKSKPIATQPHNACIYLLGSLVNHCCTPKTPRRPKSAEELQVPDGPNCSWRIGPQGLAKFVLKRHICVQARRDIKEGEQLTWDYGKQDLGFMCECSTCRPPTGPHCGVM
jgi:hypothetical protein